MSTVPNTERKLVFQTAFFSTLLEHTVKDATIELFGHLIAADINPMTKLYFVIFRNPSMSSACFPEEARSVILTSSI